MEEYTLSFQTAQKVQAKAHERARHVEQKLDAERPVGHTNCLHRKVPWAAPRQRHQMKKTLHDPVSYA